MCFLWPARDSLGRAKLCFFMACFSNVEVSPEECVIRRSQSSSRLDVDIDLAASLRQRLGSKNVIQAPSLILLQRAWAEIVPECEQLLFWIELAEDIDEAPGHCVLICIADTLVKADMLQMFFRAVNINRFRRHVHVAAPDGWTILR
jgi:hypothetical protein